MDPVKAEKHFNALRMKIRGAESVNDMIDIMSDPIKPQAKDWYKKKLRKYLNRQYRGDVKKSRARCLQLINVDEHEFFNALYEEGL